MKNPTTPTAPILTPDTYFSSEAELYYMGSTQFKRFMQCESMGLAAVVGDYREEPSTALMVGSYVDAHFSSSLGLFKAENPQMFKRDGSLKADFEQANEIIARAERDRAFTSALSGEAQIIMTGEIEGVPVKIRVDSLLPDRIVDLKVMRDMNHVWTDTSGYVPFWKAWRYDIQGAIYREVVRQNTGKMLPFGLAVATKEKTTNIALLEFPHAVLDVALDEVRASIVHFDSLKKGLYDPESCGECPVCREKKVLEGWEIIC